MITLAVLGWIFVFLQAKMAVSGEWRLPVTAACIAVIITRGGAPRFWGSELRIKNGVINRAIGILVSTGLVAAILISLNFIPHPGKEDEVYKCPIERLYKTTHQHTRRVGRHYTTTGSVYYRYHADVRLRDGKVKEYPLTLNRYRKLHKGDSLSIEIHHGLLGMDYFTPAKNKNNDSRK
ncbi:MAG: hypothetical protein K2L96_01290 [Muribaculaceae bacterium]|nr:hypothetical protein [Muribaculaceae bacterium]